MIIVIHVDEAGNRHFVNTDVSQNGAIFADPRGGTGKLDILQLLDVLKADAQLRTKGGWDQISSLSGSGKPMTMWEVLQSQMAKGA